MAIGVLILGESGSGKSYSMRNLSADEAKVISVEKPILPFKNHLEVTRTNDVDKIVKELKSTDKKIAVIDDFQYILGLAAMRRSLEKGWDKFSEMQFDYFKILDALKDLPEDMIVYFMSHTETDENGVTKIKTIGKALDKYITIEGLFMIVLGTRVSDGNYYFITQTNGKDTLKTPAGMFPSYAIDNDLKYVDEKIRNYYEIGEFLTDDEMAEIDEAAKKVDVIKDDGKKGRRRAKKEEPAETPAEEKKEETSDEIKPARRSRSSKTREEVAADNAEKVANAGLDEAGDAEEVDFDNVENPDTEKMPRRTRKDRSAEANDKVQEDAESKAACESDSTTEQPSTRRTRRSEQTEPAETNNSEAAAETSEEQPTQRRRRRRA